MGSNTKPEIESEIKASNEKGREKKPEKGYVSWSYENVYF